jgi:ATP-dependent Clp protease protease subunit
MVEISVNIPIGPEAENRWLASWGEEPVFFSMETVKRIFSENPDEKDFKFNFNCDGGYVDEGLAIYDTIRTSGKNIYCNIEGGCHSMAIVMLLAAPLENRTANPNCRALIHNVRGEMWGDMTASQLEAAAEEMRTEEDAILNIYADRTGQDIDTLRSLMNEEKVRTADELLQYGFIGKVNQYNTNLRTRKNNPITNQNQRSMAKTKQQAVNDAKSVLDKIKNLLGGKATNFDHTDADGNVMFTTDAEDDHLEVGMTASPDGTFTLAAATSEFPEGTTVVIADGAITEINEPTTEGEEELENLRAENEQLRSQLQEASLTIEDLMSQLQSNYKPTNGKRNIAPAAPASNKEDKEGIKNELRALHGLKNKED